MALHRSRLQLEQKYIFSRTSNREQDSHWYRIISRKQWTGLLHEYRMVICDLQGTISRTEIAPPIDALVILRVWWYGENNKNNERNKLNNTTDAKTPSNCFHIRNYNSCCESQGDMNQRIYLERMDWKSKEVVLPPFGTVEGRLFCTLGHMCFTLIHLFDRKRTQFWNWALWKTPKKTHGPLSL